MSARRKYSWGAPEGSTLGELFELLTRKCYKKSFGFYPSTGSGRQKLKNILRQAQEDKTEEYYSINTVRLVIIAANKKIVTVKERLFEFLWITGSRSDAQI